jgi:uncharacterized protein (DUF2062 family)
MPRRFLNRVLPARAHLQGQWFLRPFSALLHDPALWATHRKNVLKALGVGIFVSFLPIPGQTVLAVLIALWLRVNLAVAAVGSWLANPVTIPPLFYACYAFGSWILNTPPGDVAVELSFEWLGTELARIWKPLLLGCLVLGSISAAGSVLVLNALWIRSSQRRFAKRRRPTA